jgi:tetratricopeptide (TPR) repeat protein
MIEAGVKDACLIFMRKYPFLVEILLFPFVLSIPQSVAQGSKRAAPSDLSSPVARALHLADSGKCKEAIPLLKRVLPQTSDKELKRSAGLDGVRCAMTTNQFDAAEDFLRMLNREFPGDPEVLYTSVHTYSDLATRASQQLATTAPNSAQAHELNAESLEMQGKWDQAAKEYEAIVHQNPRLPGLHFRLGRLLLSEANPPADVSEQAKKEFQQELEIDPNNAGAEYVLGELARQDSQWPEAVAHFTRAAKLDAGFGDAYLGLGVTLISAKRFSEAVAPLETAVKLEPRNPAAHYNLAMAYNRAGRKEDADKEFRVHRQMTEKAGAKPDAPPGAPPENSN